MKMRKDRQRGKGSFHESSLILKAKPNHFNCKILNKLVNQIKQNIKILLTNHD